jgi:hypothetical protein
VCKVGKSSFGNLYARYHPLEDAANLYAGLRRLAQQLLDSDLTYRVEVKLLAVAPQLAFPGAVGDASANRLMECLEAVFTQCTVDSICELEGGAPAYGDAVHFTHEARVWCGKSHIK